MGFITGLIVDHFITKPLINTACNIINKFDGPTNDIYFVCDLDIITNYGDKITCTYLCEADTCNDDIMVALYNDNSTRMYNGLPVKSKAYNRRNVSEHDLPCEFHNMCIAISEKKYNMYADQFDNGEINIEIDYL